MLICTLGIFMNSVQVIAVEGLPLIQKGNNLGKLIVEAAEKQGTPLQSNDVVVVTHVVVSKAEGNVINLDTVNPSERAQEIAAQTKKDPALVQVILNETKEIVRIGQNSIITETKSGIICANAGVDRSNVSGDRNVVPLPENPNASAQHIRSEIKRAAGVDVAVIVSDTHGRPFRMGEINIAVGTSGFKPIRDRRGEKDLFGYVLRIKQTAVADELASAAELVIGQANEGIPVAIIRGYHYLPSEESSATSLTRAKEKDLFR
ncbi:MAG: coenzyme F420-0:L-glutamate ligase [Candidatus Bathyarchaeota archaeon]|nr:coenzyme F420-0:L-glutamate ligase [Candidatus Bathyarchaeota archaeon]